MLQTLDLIRVAVTALNMEPLRRTVFQESVRPYRYAISTKEATKYTGFTDPASKKIAKDGAEEKGSQTVETKKSEVLAGDFKKRKRDEGHNDPVKSRKTRGRFIKWAGIASNVGAQSDTWSPNAAKSRPHLGPKPGKASAHISKMSA